MRKSLLIATIAGALLAPVAQAQVGVNLGGGAGVNVGTSGAQGRLDLQGRIDARGADAATAGARNKGARGAQAARNAVTGTGSEVRDTARSGAQAVEHASAQATGAVVANGNAMANSVLGQLDAGTAAGAEGSVAAAGAVGGSGAVGQDTSSPDSQASEHGVREDRAGDRPRGRDGGGRR